MKKSKKKALVITAGVLALAAAGGFAFMKSNLDKIPEMTALDTIKYTTKNRPDAAITVGFIQGGQMTYKVYGQNGEELMPDTNHIYEIGSLTKTMTAALVNKACSEGLIDLNATVDKYLDLAPSDGRPTVKELLTHTSGFRGYYFEKPMLSNHLNGRNDFYGVNKDMLLNRLNKLNTGGGEHDFKYSNFGYATLGLVLESVYGKDYTAVFDELFSVGNGFLNTGITDIEGDLDNYWDWKPDDAYIPAGAVKSDIDDMMHYAFLLMNDDEHFGACRKKIKTINASSGTFRSLDINMDSIGMGWMIDENNGYCWHNGGTGNYNSYLAFNAEKQLAVVVLSNLPPAYRIPATVTGAKYMQEIETMVVAKEEEPRRPDNW
jgi:CubicO group peptidase (beta-lactamase class C family)